MHRFFLLPFCALLLGTALAASPDDCSTARDPARCAGRQQAQDACQDLRGRARQQCLLDHLPPPDCAAAEAPSRCQQRQQARAACKGLLGKAWRACLSEQDALKPNTK